MARLLACEGALAKSTATPSAVEFKEKEEIRAREVESNILSGPCWPAGARLTLPSPPPLPNPTRISTLLGAPFLYSHRIGTRYSSLFAADNPLGQLT